MNFPKLNLESDLLLLGAVAIGGYILYSKGYLSLGSSAAPAVAPSTGTQVFAAGSNNLVTLPSVFTTPNQPIPSNPAANPTRAESTYTLGDIYAAMQNAQMTIGSQFLTPGQWNSVLASVSNVVPPPVSTVFPTPGSDNMQMRLETYWATMAPWLAANQGMSGIGSFLGRWAA